MAKYFIGVDPGLNGAVAHIKTDDKGRILAANAFPSPHVKREGSKKSYPDFTGMTALAKAQPEAVSATIEHIHAYPGQGAVAMFSLGEGYGFWRGLFALRGVSTNTPHPHRWQPAVLNLLPPQEIPMMVKRPRRTTTRSSDNAPKTVVDTKMASVMLAQKLFPNVNLILPGKRGKRVPHDGMSDALLLALFGKMLHFGDVPERSATQYPIRRGRKRKTPSNEPPQPKRPRGRPRKYPMPDPNAPKRPRGRPRKIPL